MIQVRVCTLYKPRGLIVACLALDEYTSFDVHKCGLRALYGAPVILFQSCLFWIYGPHVLIRLRRVFLRTSA